MNTFLRFCGVTLCGVILLMPYDTMANPQLCAMECRHEGDRSIEDCDRETNNAVSEYEPTMRQDMMNNLLNIFQAPTSADARRSSQQNYNNSEYMLDLSRLQNECKSAARSEYSRCMERCGYRR